MGRSLIVTDAIAHAGFQYVLAAVFVLNRDIACEHQDDMTFMAPVVRHVVRAV